LRCNFLERPIIFLRWGIPGPIKRSQLELGRAFQLAGDRENAKRLFRNLTDIWKDADPDFPPLKQLRDYEGRFAVQR